MKNLDKYLTLLGGDVDGLLLTSRYSRHYGAEFDIAEEGLPLLHRQPLHRVRRKEPEGL